MSLTETAAQVNAVLEDEAPAMQDPPLLTVDLAVGVETVNGWTTTAEVRELTGEDEERLASFEQKKDILYVEYMTEVLRLAVTSVGSIAIADDPSILGKLSIADRDTLFLGIVKATYGNTREIKVACPSCSESNDVLLELDVDFPIIRPTFDPRVGLEVTTKKATYNLRLPNGDDMTRVESDELSVAAFNTLILANCAMFDKSPPKDRVAWAKKLNVGERKQLIDALLNIKLGPDLREVDTHCASCKEKLPLLLDWVSLLLG